MNIFNRRYDYGGDGLCFPGADGAERYPPYPSIQAPDDSPDSDTRKYGGSEVYH
jgi:hypothetical protein